MTKNAVNASYLRSFLCVLAFVAIMVAASNVVELIFVDFVHGNPHRPKSNALEMMIFFTPLFAAIAAIGAILVFGLPQCLEATFARTLMSRFGDMARFWTLCALPLTAILTWYCYDFLTPTDFNLGINEGPDWTPYQHGLTGQRYAMALAAQAPITIFNLVFLDAGLHGRSRKAVVFAGLAIAAIFGIAWGRHLAIAQFRFL